MQPLAGLEALRQIQRRQHRCSKRYVEPRLFEAMTPQQYDARIS